MKNKNEGFSFIVVILLMVITTIMVVTAIVIVNANWKMKQTEKLSVQSTYNAEAGLNDIVEDLQVVCQECLEHAYTETLTTGGTLTRTSLDTIFANKYIAYLESYFTMHNIDEALSSFLTQPNTTYQNGVTYEIDNKNHTFTLKNVSVVYTGSDNSSETVITDIQINTPVLFGETANTNTLIQEYGKYSIITDRSLVSTTGDIKITGSVYAGGTNDDNAANPTAENRYYIETEGISVGKDSSNSNIEFNSDRIITRSDIVTYNNDSTLTVKGYNKTLADVYTNNIITKKRSGSAIAENNVTVIDGTGNFYVKGDTLLNARYCDIKLAGTYRGFTPKTSAFLINGRSVNANLSELTTLMLSGVSYIDIPIALEDNASIMMGDSLTGKFIQTIYMVPPTCVHNKETGALIGNPITETDKDNISIDWDTYNKTYGINILDFVDVENPVSYIVPTQTSGSIENGKRMYLYLNFKSEDSAAAFLQTFNKYFSNYLDDRSSAFNYGNITIADSASLFTMGNLITNQNGKVTVVPNTVNGYSPFLEMQNETILKDYNSLASTLLPFSYTGIYDLNDSLFDFVINKEKIDSPEECKHYNDTTLVETKDTPWEVADTHYHAKDVVTYVENAKCDVSDENKLYSAIVSKGDVTILNGDTYGIVITEGSCTLNAGARFHGTIIAKEGIKLSSGSVNVTNIGYHNSSVLTWFLDTYTCKDLIREHFEQIVSENNEVTTQSVNITYKNWVTY